MDLRVSVSTFPMLVEVRDNDLIGLLSMPFALSVRGLRRIANVSLQSNSGLGKQVNHLTHEYDGCLGQLQRNQSDICIPMSEYPISAPGIQNGFPITTSAIELASAYRFEEAKSAPTVLDAFKSFTIRLWLMNTWTLFSLAFLLLAILVILRSTRLTTRKSKKLICWMTKRYAGLTLKVATGNLVKQQSSYQTAIIRRSISGRVTLLLIIVFCFLISFFFGSMMKTERVVQRRPDTISSYKELLSHKGLKPVWAKQLNNHMEFASATKGSVEHEIWERAVKVGVDKCLIRGDLVTTQAIAVQIMKRESVFLGPSYVIPVLRSNICTFSRESGIGTAYRAWVARDSRSKEKMMVFMQSAFLSKSVAERINRHHQTGLEMSLKTIPMRRMDNIISSRAPTQSVRECVSNSIAYPEHEDWQPGMDHYFSLVLMSGCAHAFSLLVFVVERLFSRFPL